MTSKQLNLAYTTNDFSDNKGLGRWSIGDCWDKKTGKEIPPGNWFGREILGPKSSRRKCLSDCMNDKEARGCFFFTADEEGNGGCARYTKEIVASGRKIERRENLIDKHICFVLPGEIFDFSRVSPIPLQSNKRNICGLVAH